MKDKRQKRKRQTDRDYTGWYKKLAWRNINGIDAGHETQRESPRCSCGSAHNNDDDEKKGDDDVNDDDDDLRIESLSPYQLFAMHLSVSFFHRVAKYHLLTFKRKSIFLFVFTSAAVTRFGVCFQDVIPNAPFRLHR